MKANEISGGKPNYHEPEAQPLTSNNWEDYTPFRNERGEICYCFLYQGKKLVVNREDLDPDKDTPFAAAQEMYDISNMTPEEFLEPPIELPFEAPPDGWTQYELDFLRGVEKVLQEEAQKTWTGQLACHEWHCLPAKEKREYIHNPEKGIKKAKSIGWRYGVLLGFFGSKLIRSIFGNNQSS